MTDLISRCDTQEDVHNQCVNMIINGGLVPYEKIYILNKPYTKVANDQKVIDEWIVFNDDTEECTRKHVKVSHYMSYILYR